MTAPSPGEGFAASIFDMDGLLLDSEILWHEAEIEILGGLGVPLSGEGCRGTKGMFVGEVTEYWHARYPWAAPTPAEVAVAIVDRVISLVLSKGELKPGAEHAIALCAERNLPLAVASSSEYRLIDTALAHFGLREHFRARALGRGRAVGEAAPRGVPDGGGQAGRPAAPLPRLGGRSRRCVGRQGSLHVLYRCS